MLPQYLLELFIFAIGASIGSFLNVCIYRLPRSLSIISPPSACPVCDNPIRPYDNIPILSYILLAGRCRRCGLPISPRYPMVELVSGLCAIAVCARFGYTLQALVLFIFISALIVVIFIDIDHQIIPDVISLPGIVLCFLASVFIFNRPVAEPAAGILVGGGSLLLVAVTYRLLTGRDGMGGGDIKLLAMIGALCGWEGVLFTIFLSSLAGTLVGILLMVAQGRNLRLALPYGPFLSLSAIVYIFLGPDIIHWYFNILNRIS